MSDIRGNGKIVLTDFKKLNPKDFEPLYHCTRQQLKEIPFLLSRDGRWLVNKREPNSEELGSILEIIVWELKDTLILFRSEILERFPQIKDFEDIALMKDNSPEEQINVIVALLTPMEIQRRQIERAYW